MSKFAKQKVEPNEKLIPEVNIGMVGHVAHGKTSLVESLTGKSTLTHSEELKRGITIRLGYADATFYKCPNNHYCSTEKCPICFSDCETLRTVSFIDAPGHETLMATVMTGASLMDGAILLIAANEKCPQPQTIEHLTALEVVGIKNVIIVQNKIDLVSEDRVRENYEEIKNFVKGTILENSPIIPLSAQQRINIDVLIEAIEKLIPTPAKKEDKELRMFVARSFDINKPGTEPKKLVGGVLGGAIISGKLKIGDEIEIKPGVKIENKYQTIKTKIIGLQKAKVGLEEASAGGLLGVMTALDPLLTKSDSLVGNIVGTVGTLPEARNSLSLEVNYLERKDIPAESPIKINDNFLVNVGTARSLGTVTVIKKNRIELALKIPVMVEKEKVVLSKQIAGKWRLIGYGNTV